LQWNYQLLKQNDKSQQTGMRAETAPTAEKAKAALAAEELDQPKQQKQPKRGDQLQPPVKARRQDSSKHHSGAD
jgi:hypothetical protein